MRTLLIDGDIFAYQAAAGAERPYEFEGVYVLSADLEVGKENLTHTIDGFKERLEADEIIVCLSDDLNYRKDVLPTYKSNRDGVRRPMILKELKAHLEETYRCFTKPTLEADDVLGILATHPTIIKGEKIIVTEDKDLRTVPGLHFNPKKEGAKEPQKPTVVSELEADNTFYAQILSGDMVDGYSGCPGIGIQRAAAIVSNPVIWQLVRETVLRGPNQGTIRARWVSSPTTDLWASIVSHYEKAGLTEEDALKAARVARILRADDYNFKTKEVILWDPSYI